MSDLKLTVVWEERHGQRRVKHVRLYVPCYRSETEGDVTVKLTEREADELLSSYVRQLRTDKCKHESGHMFLTEVGMARVCDECGFQDFKV